jgi:hypothetical protein
MSDLDLIPPYLHDKVMAIVPVQGVVGWREGFPVLAGNLVVCGAMRSSWCGQRGVTR